MHSIRDSSQSQAKLLQLKSRYFEGVAREPVA
jgi:hypothetical protein